MPAVNQDKYIELDNIIARNKSKRGAVMLTLQEAQELLGCVPKDVQIRIAEGLNTTLSDVYGVATFYSQFSLAPHGKNMVSVCMGTACYVKGSKDILDKACEALKTGVGKTSEDGLFTVKDTRCLGACGLAPVMMINDEVYGRLTPDQVPTILNKYRAD